MAERLTNRTHDGHAYLVNVKDDEQEVECKSENTAQCILDSWERLAAYEDTGLTPEEIAHAKDLLAAEKDGQLYTVHDVAVILANAIGDDCACNINSNDEWLPQLCELQEACPEPVGVACWEQYLKHRAEAEKALGKEAQS